MALAGIPLAAWVAAQLFGGYQAKEADADRFNEFTLDRAEAGAVWDGESRGLELRLEAIRSAGPGSLLGIDRDSLVLRVKRGWAWGRFDLGAAKVELRGGLIPDPWIDALEQDLPLRESGALPSEQAGLLVPADLGASAGVSFAGDRLFAAMAITNGEGLNEVELNDGKNTTFLVGGRVPWSGGAAAVRLFGRDGSSGVGAGRDHRFGGAATLALVPGAIQAGAEYVRAYGVRGDATRDADSIGAWLAARPLGRGGDATAGQPGWAAARFGGFLRWEMARVDLDRDDSARQRIDAGVYWLAGDGMRLSLAYEQTFVGLDAGPVPGLPDVAEARGVVFRFAVEADTRRMK